ncbi:MAG: hypothetical protein C0616_04540 [Desulfuromonas sp.]|mgnify:CR=1 FL=1|nr:MAG: hypothetical protein C0616_04540 [Desulfuromonas sp.]
MLGKKGKSQPMRRESSSGGNEIKAFLGPGSQFEGKLQFNEIVRLDGHFRGEIISDDTLIVGETAEIEAEVTVGSLILSGTIKGNIKASGKVELKAPANVIGNIDTPVLSVEEGVTLNSTLTMKSAIPAEKPVDIS